MPEDTQPATSPVQEKSQETTAAPTTEVVAHNSAGTMLLQWLSYAFWGWTVLSLAWLTGMSVGYFLDTNKDGMGTESIAYSLAAVIVLFVISLVCDLLYARREPLKKHGAAMVIMIVHSVLFALFAIGALIIAVFAIVRLLIGDGEPGGSYGENGTLTMLITGLIISVVYGATLLRTLRPMGLRRGPLLYWLFMTVVTGAVVALAITGPALYARMTRDDRLIESGLPSLSETIRSYTAKTDALPTSLADVRDQATGDARTLIDRNLVEYKPGKKVEVNASDLPTSIEPARPIAAPDEPAYQYTLCVTYKAKKGSSGSTTYPEYPATDGVSPDTYYHDAGRVCYELQTSYSYAYSSKSY